MIGFVPCDLKAGKMCIKIMTTTEQNKTSILIIVFFIISLKIWNHCCAYMPSDTDSEGPHHNFGHIQ